MCLSRSVHCQLSKSHQAHVLYIMKETQERVKSQPNYGTGEAAANLNRRFIGLVMRYAIATMRAEIDPTYAVRDVIEMPEVEHARPLSKKEKELLRKNLDSYNGTATVRNVTLMMLYSMLRTIEIRRMEWSFVDFEEKTITFPKASRRLGQERTMKKNRIHVVPMSTQIEALLRQQQSITFEKKYVFASPYNNESMLSRTTLNKMLKYLGLENVTAHDFRATASTELNSLGYNSDWIEAQLAHADANKTRASYNHAKYIVDRRKMLQDWADIIDNWSQ